MVLLAIITTYYWFSIICLDCGLWTIFRFTRALKFDVGLLINEQLFKIFFRNAILKMWYDYEIILLKKGLNILRKIWKSIYTGLHYFYYIVELFCIRLHKSYFIMAIVVQVSDVIYVPLVFISFRNFKQIYRIAGIFAAFIYWLFLYP